MHTASAKFLYGDIVAEKIRNQVKIGVDRFQKAYHRTPHIAVILSFDNLASKIYVSKKVEACREVGIRSTTITTPCDNEEELLRIIHDLNNDNDIDAILVQFPLHPSIDLHKITDAIDPTKDVDGFSPVNLGKLVQGRLHGLVPCTPKGIVKLLDYYDIPVSGQHVAIIGRSMVVGKPLSLLLSSTDPIGNATVTILHSQSKNIPDITKKADIVVVAAGKPGLLTENMVKEGAVVIDVGINRIHTPEGKSKLVGDVDFISVAQKASAITPVPKGIGPMTVACLLENALLAATLRATKSE